MYIIGGLDDQTLLLSWSGISNNFFSLNPSISIFLPYKEIFNPLLHPLSNNQPIFSLFISIILTIFGIKGLNFFIFFTSVVNFFSSSIFFKRFKFWYVYSLIFTFSAYTWSHIGIHNALSQIWILPVFLHFLLHVNTLKSVKKSILFGVLITAIILISNYLGFIVLLLYVFYIFSLFIYDLIFDSTKSIRKLDYKLLKNFALSLFVAFILTTLFLFPYIKANYLNNSSYKKNTTSLNAVRPYEDFFTFSSRPWYYILPPVDNPLLGKLSSLYLAKLSSTNYFLADDYFKGEHQASYFGILLLILTTFVFSYVVKFGDKKNKRIVYIFSSVLFLFFLFSLPPFFTISSKVFFTPGYLIYKFFPVFRVTARFSIAMLFCILVILAYGEETIAKKINLKILKLVLTSVLMLTLIETYIPPKIVEFKPPSVFKYLKQNTPEGTKFAVYPYGKTEDALFWLFEHERYLVNIRDYQTNNFNSKDFTMNLLSVEGVQNLKKMGGSYVVVYNKYNDFDKKRIENIDGLSYADSFEDYSLFLVEK